jgi:hypothetical protein
MTQTALQKAAPKIASLPARLELVARAFDPVSAEARACRQAAGVIRVVTSWAEGLEVKLKRLEELVR